MAPGQSASDREKALAKARLSKFREKVYTNPELLEEYRRKERERYQKRKQNGQIKTQDLTKKQHEKKKKQWRENSKRYYRRKKQVKGDMPSSIEEDDPLQHIQEANQNHLYRQVSSCGADSEQLSMDRVVLHHQPPPTGQLRALLRQTERVLETFPTRVPPAFSPWFPSSRDRWLPIRPSRPAPMLSPAVHHRLQEESHALQASAHRDGKTSTPVLQRWTSNAGCEEPAEPPRNPSRAEGTQRRPVGVGSRDVKDGRPHTQTERTRPQEPKHVPRSAEPSSDLHPEKPNARADAPWLSPENPPQQRHHDNVEQEAEGEVAPPPREVRRSWSVLVQHGVRLQRPPSLSRLLQKLVWRHRLHLHQRARWVMGQSNWVLPGGLEQVWRELRHVGGRGALPTCNATVHREQQQIWVFCDLLYAEHVGRNLKEKLQLHGEISLTVGRLGSILSL